MEQLFKKNAVALSVSEINQSTVEHEEITYNEDDGSLSWLEVWHIARDISALIKTMSTGLREIISTYGLVDGANDLIAKLNATTAKLQSVVSQLPVDKNEEVTDDTHYIYLQLSNELFTLQGELTDDVMTGLAELSDNLNVSTEENENV